jgi:tetratricopeptide (TPR) repeat protein
MLLGLVRCLAFAILLGILTPQSGRAQNNDLDALDLQVVQLYRQGKYNEAIQIAERALALSEKKFGPDHPSVGTSLNYLVQLYRLQGRYGAAERLNKRPLAIHEKALGPDHPDVAAALSNLAVLYFGQSDWPRATDYFRRGTDVIAKRTRHDTQMIGRTLIGKKTTEVAEQASDSQFSSNPPIVLRDKSLSRMVYVEDPLGIVFELYSHSYELTYSSGAYT